MKFLPANQVAVASKNTVKIFKLDDAKEVSPAFITKFETEQNIVSLLTTNDRQKLALLLEGGKIEIRDLD